MESDQPLLLLDVDGVLNPFPPVECPPEYDEYSLFEGEEPVRLCSLHGQWVRELSVVFQVVWATAWGENANRLLGPLLGLPSLPVVPLPATPFPPDAKTSAINTYVARQCAVWIDDCHTAQAKQWAGREPSRRVLLTVDATTGWTRSTVDAALAWARRWGQS